MGRYYYPVVVRTPLQMIDQRGMPVVVTTGIVEETDPQATVTYGINPCVWKALPCQCVILWKVRHPVSTASASSPVSVAIPSRYGSSTVTNSSTTGSANKIPVIDKKGTQVIGSDVTNPQSGEISSTNYADHLVYINKSCGIFRMLAVDAQTAPAPSDGGSSDVSAAASANSVKK